jgi:hypothetical protein
VLEEDASVTGWDTVSVSDWVLGGFDGGVTEWLDNPSSGWAAGSGRDSSPSRGSGPASQRSMDPFRPAAPPPWQGIVALNTIHLAGRHFPRSEHDQVFHAPRTAAPFMFRSPHTPDHRRADTSAETPLGCGAACWLRCRGRPPSNPVQRTLPGRQPPIGHDDLAYYAAQAGRELRCLTRSHCQDGTAQL